MAKGEIPIAYIIALILGIAVVAVLGYWFFIVQKGGGNEMSIAECRTKAVEYCSTWKSAQWDGYNVPDGDPPAVGGFIGDKWFSKDSSSNSGTPPSPFAPQCTNTGLDERSKSTMKTSCETIV